MIDPRSPVSASIQPNASVGQEATLMRHRKTGPLFLNIVHMLEGPNLEFVIRSSRLSDMGTQDRRFIEATRLTKGGSAYGI